MAIIFGTRSLAQRLGYRSPQSVINRHEKRNEVNPLPMYPRFKGRNWVWCSDDALLVEWQRREAELSRNCRIVRARMPRRKHRKTLQEGFADGRKEWTFRAFSGGKETEPIRASDLPPPPDRRPEQPARSLSTEGLQGGGSPTSPIACGCTCGTAVPCAAHNEVGQG